MRAPPVRSCLHPTRIVSINWHNMEIIERLRTKHASGVNRIRSQRIIEFTKRDEMRESLYKTLPIEMRQTTLTANVHI